MRRPVWSPVKWSALALAATLPLSAIADEKNPQAVYDQMSIFADVLAIVQNEYVEEVDPASLVENALNGALQSLDPHSSYVPPVDFTEQREAVRREYGGLGIEIQSEGGLVKVNFAIEEGPAYKAGIRGGDFITAVDGTDIRGKSLDEAVSGMRGLKGEAVTVTVLSPDKVARDIVVVRDTVRGRAIRHRVEQGVGYIQIETFNNDKLTEDTERALADLNTRMGKLDKLVIDLRGNRGGLLTESVSISGLFLDGGEVLSARGRDASDNERYNAEDGELYPDAKIVVLVSPGSASAAEIVAGALQDRGRGVVLGRRSFGKGSVQSVIPLGAEDGALRLTTQRYYTPSGASIQGRGIMPDLLVSSLEDSGEIRKRFREDSLRNFLSNPDETDYEEKYDDILYAPDTFPDDEDFQLRKAVEVLKTSQYERLLQAQSEKY
ncbi:MAG: S41 family peptidase [Litorimonas sp.]